MVCIISIKFWYYGHAVCGAHYVFMQNLMSHDYTSGMNFESACRLKEKLKSHDWQDFSNIGSCGMCFHFEDTDSFVCLVHVIKAGHSQLPATKNTKREHIPCNKLGWPWLLSLQHYPNKFSLHTQEGCSHNYEFAVKKTTTNTHLRY